MSEPYYADESVTIWHGNALDLPLPDESVDLVVTSPPYFGLRSYTDGGEHYEGQIGSEASPREFVDALIAATAEMVRVLKPAVDEIREPLLDTSPHAAGRRQRTDARLEMADAGMTSTANPMGKLPGSVWDVPTQPLRVPSELGIDHFAAFPMEWPRRLIRGWSPSGICIECGEGRRPITAKVGSHREGGYRPDNNPLARRPDEHRTTMAASTLGMVSEFAVTGYACACDAPTAPTRPAVVLDPFGGTGTTALVAKALGRTGWHVDLSADYCRLAQWRVNDPGELARAMQVEKPPAVPEDMDSLLDLLEDGAA